MIDPIFNNPQLAAIYDAFDGERRDLDAYVAIVKELGAQSVLDIGCGTGNFASLLAGQGYDVTGIDPAQASLDIARQKLYAEKVKWILGDAFKLPRHESDVAVMTGNVAQVFLTDQDWQAALHHIHRAVRPQGHLVFEVRDPVQKAWLGWTRDKTYQRLDIPNIGAVTAWCDTTNVAEELVSFRWTYTFEASGTVLTSSSTLRFRSKEAIVTSLEKSGYKVTDIRDAPDRPKCEFVFIAEVVW